MTKVIGFVGRENAAGDPSSPPKVSGFRRDAVAETRCQGVVRYLELQWTSQLLVSAYGISEDPEGQKSKSSHIARVTIT